MVVSVERIFHLAVHFPLSCKQLSSHGFQPHQEISPDHYELTEPKMTWINMNKDS